MPEVKFEDSNLLRKALDYAKPILPNGYSFKRSYSIWTLNAGFLGCREIAMFSKDRTTVYLYDENELDFVKKITMKMEEFYGDATVIKISVK